MEFKPSSPMRPEDARQLNGLQLAFVGDSLYDLFARTEIVFRHDQSVQLLHKRAVGVVNAQAQARAFARLEPLLTPEEADVARRARNAHSRPPKNQTPGDYARATALEALLGYTYLCGRVQRLNELLNHIAEEELTCRKENSALN